MWRHPGRQTRDKGAIDVQSQNRPASLGEGQGERPSPGADFEKHVARLDANGRDNPPRPGLCQKMLAETLAWPGLELAGGRRRAAQGATSLACTRFTAIGLPDFPIPRDLDVHHSSVPDSARQYCSSISSISSSDRPK
jgi:hypothetical protein